MSTVSTAPPPVSPKGPNDDLTSLLPKKLLRARPLFDRDIVGRATRQSFVKLILSRWPRIP